MNISQSQRTDLIEEVAYLEHEAEALKYVIDLIPYDKKTKSGRSVLEALLYLDHAQQHYFRKVIEDAHKSVRPININSYVNPSDSFEVSEDDKDVQKVLYKIAKHRVSLINLLQNISLIIQLYFLENHPLLWLKLSWRLFPVENVYQRLQTKF